MVAEPAVLTPASGRSVVGGLGAMEAGRLVVHPGWDYSRAMTAEDVNA